ncbi:MAG TPA: phosphatase PAP2 family protein [Streptosporangiaceae bacterium]|nr:phosphatase PAP2 family protein [Streptosporangiaceae bacterium]
MPSHPARAWSAAGLVTPQRWGVRLAHADRAIFATVLAHRRPAVISAAQAVSGLAEPGVIYPVLAAAGLVRARRAGWPQTALPCLVVAGGAAVRRQLSRAIARPRPPASVWLTEPDGFSLPSRHTALAALAAGAGTRALGIGGAPRRVAPLLAAAGVGASRVCLGVHWPGDVLAGWLFAGAWLFLTDCEAAVSGSDPDLVTRART